jgi:hypothetical protein
LDFFEELEQFEAWKLEGQKIRNWVKWKLKGNFGTKEFYCTVKPKIVQFNITELVNGNGVSCFDQNQMEEIYYSYFRDLYKLLVIGHQIRILQRNKLKF